MESVGRFSLRTGGYIAVAYATCGGATVFLVGGASLPWALVLLLNFLLVWGCAYLARFAANDVELAARTEALALGIATIAPVGTQAVQYVLQSMGGDKLDIRGTSVVGRLIHYACPQSEVPLYIMLLLGWAALSTVIAVIGARRANAKRTLELSHWFAIMLLSGSALLLLPWFGEVYELKPVAIPIEWIALSLAAGFTSHRLNLFFDRLRTSEIGAGQRAQYLLAVPAAFVTVALILIAVLKAAVSDLRELRAALAGMDTATRVIAGCGTVILLAVLADFPKGGFAAWLRAIARRLQGVGRTFERLMTSVVNIVRNIGLLRFRSLDFLILARVLGSSLPRLHGRPVTFTIVGAFALLATCTWWPGYRPAVLQPNRVRLTRDGTLSNPDQPPPPRSPPLPEVPRIRIEPLSITCRDPRWSLGRSDQIVMPLGRCHPEAPGSILIAFGSATPLGQPTSEEPRARRRARTLAAQLRNWASEGGDTPRIYLLSRGIEASDGGASRVGPPLTVLSGVVEPVGSSVDDAAIARAVEAWLRTRGGNRRYTRCEFTALTADGRLASSPLALDCSDRLDPASTP